MLSVIIPTSDRPELLRACLQSLAHQNIPSEAYEVIVADDGSSYDVTDLVENEFATSGLNVRVVCNPKLGAAFARNAAAAVAGGDILAFLDDDAVVNRYWVANVLKAFQKKGVDVITGRILPLQSGLFSAARQARYDRRRNRALADRNHRATFLAGGNSAIRRALFEQVGGFDTSFVMMHDFELLLRLERFGYRCQYVDDVEIHHLHVKQRRDAFINSFRAGYYRLLLMRQHPEQRALARQELLSIVASFAANDSESIGVRLLNACLNGIHLGGFVLARSLVAGPALPAPAMAPGGVSHVRVVTAPKPSTAAAANGLHLARRVACQ